MSSPVYNVSVGGNSNDTDLMIQSAGSTITDNAAHHPHESHPHLETSINELNERLQKQENTHLLLRKLIYDPDVHGGLGEAAYNNINILIGDFVNNLPFVGELTGLVYTPQLTAMSSFSGKCHYMGGKNSQTPRINYDMTLTADDRIGVKELIFKSEIDKRVFRDVPVWATAIDSSFIDAQDVNKDLSNNGILIIKTMADWRFKIYLDLYLKVDKLFEIQKIPFTPIYNDDGTQTIGLTIPEFKIETTLLELNGLTLNYPLNNSENLKLFHKYDINYLKSLQNDAYYLAKQDRTKWKVHNEDITLFSFENEAFSVYVANYGSLKEVKNIIFSLANDVYHSNGNDAFDRLTNPWFSAGNNGLQISGALQAGLLCAQTGLLTYVCINKAKSGIQVDFNPALKDFDVTIPELLSILKINSLYDLHVIAGQTESAGLNVHGDKAFENMNVKNIVMLQNLFLFQDEETLAKIYNGGGLDASGNSPDWNPLFSIATPNSSFVKDMLFSDFITNILKNDAFLLCGFMFFNQTFCGTFDLDKLNPRHLKLIRLLLQNQEYGGALWGVFMSFYTNGFSSLPSVSNFVDVTKFSDPNNIKVKDLFVPGYNDKYYLFNRNSTLYKNAHVYITGTGRFGGNDYGDGVDYGEIIEQKIPENSCKELTIINELEKRCQNINYLPSTPLGFNPPLLKFFQDNGL